MNRIAIHVGHDATVATEIDGKLTVIELERYYGIRHFDLYRSEVPREEIADLVFKETGTRDFDTGSFVGHVRHVGIPAGEQERWDACLNVKHWSFTQHHLCHAASAFYLSPFERAVVISYDGGGDDGFFRAYLANRESGATPIKSWGLNLGGAYSALAYPIREIYKPPDNVQGAGIRNAGKLMGLGAYGKPREEWFKGFREFYLLHPKEYQTARSKRLVELGPKIGLNLDAIRDCIDGQTGRDFAATAAYIFEDIFFETVAPLLEDYYRELCDNPSFGLVVTGGCALNVVVNEKLANFYPADKIYVPPNPNDCGLALGAIWQNHPPQGRPVVTYGGLPLSDYKSGTSMFTQPGYRGTAEPWQVAKLLAEGAVIGVARGGSEHGPRALGNRSILADPGIPGLKDRLNTKIKFREVYRPYAPVVRKEDAKEYFNCQDYDMSFMSFCPTVQEKWQKTLQAITHEDGTARVQTVTPEQNQWLYAVLTEFKKIKGYGVLLNTSFNTRGKPILNTVAEAFDNLQTTDLDNLVIEDFLFEKVREGQ